MASSCLKEAASQADGYTRDVTAPAPQNSAATRAAVGHLQRDTGM